MTEADDKKVIKMIRDGLSAYQISLQLNLADAEVRSIAKRHRLGRRLMQNEGCTVRQATAEELAAYGANKKPAAPKLNPELLEPKPKSDPEVDPNEELQNAYQLVQEDIVRLKRLLNVADQFLSLRLDNRLRGVVSMKSEWRVTSNFIAGKRLYSAYRLRDEMEVDHSGNRESISEWVDTKEEAQKAADALNAKIVKRR